MGALGAWTHSLGWLFPVSLSTTSDFSMCGFACGVISEHLCELMRSRSLAANALDTYSRLG